MKKIVVCNRCGFRFDVSYARTFACSGCPHSYMGNCGMIRCPRCGNEFPIR